MGKVRQAANLLAKDEARRIAADRPDYWQVSVADLRGSNRQSQSGRRLSSGMMPHGGNWGAPSVMGAFAGFIHNRESTANYERNDDNDGY
jgi:hypothetical protein